MTTTILLTFLFFVAALLYASVGHAGASGYLAIMALFAMAPEQMKPTALAINILVAVIATIKFYQAGHFSWSIFLPFVVTSIPFSFIGGYIVLPGHLYKPIVGCVLLYAAYRLFRISQNNGDVEVQPIPLGVALLLGAGIGLLSGLTGVGGGIFLTPLLLFMHWAEPQTASGVSAPFILANSMAGLLGNFSSLGSLPNGIWVWGIAAALGGYIGSAYGSRQVNSVVMKRLLALVLLIAGLKMIFT